MKRNWMKALSSLALLCAVVLASACGGGGGGSSGAEIRILHGAIDAPPYQLCVGTCEEPALARTRFAGPAPYQSVPAGDQILIVRSVDGSSSQSLPITLTSGERRTVLLTESATASVQSMILIDGVVDIPPGYSAVRVLDGIRLAPALEIMVGNENLGTVNLSNQQQHYTLVAAGEQEVRVSDADGNKSRYHNRFDFKEGACYSLLVTGEADYLVLSSLYEDCSVQ